MTLSERRVGDHTLHHSIHATYKQAKLQWSQESQSEGARGRPGVLATGSPSSWATSHGVAAWAT